MWHGASPIAYGSDDSSAVYFTRSYSNLYMRKRKRPNNQPTESTYNLQQLKEGIFNSFIRRTSVGSVVSRSIVSVESPCRVWSDHSLASRDSEVFLRVFCPPNCVRLVRNNPNLCDSNCLFLGGPNSQYIRLLRQWALLLSESCWLSECCIDTIFADREVFYNHTKSAESVCWYSDWVLLMMMLCLDTALNNIVLYCEWVEWKNRNNLGKKNVSDVLLFYVVGRWDFLSSRLLV